MGEAPRATTANVPTTPWHVSWDEFHRDCRLLARRLGSRGPFSALVAVTRGGLVPAAVVARELDIRVIDTVSVVSYGTDDRRGEMHVVKGLGPDFVRADGGGVLVVDDLVDSGETARLLRKLLPRAHLAVVYAKPAGLPLVDTFVTAVAQDTWIHFPWDLGLSFQAPIAG